MTRLDRYVAAMIGWNLLLALAVLLAIFSVINLMDELEKVGMAQYSVRQAVWFVLMTLPAEAYELCPAAALLGSVTALGTMASKNELVALWAAGISRGRLIWMVMKAAAIVVVISFALVEFLVAPLAKRAEIQRSLALAGGPALSTANGFWTRDRDKFINIRGVSPGGELRDLYIYEFDDEHRLRAFTYAKRAAYAHRQWEITGVTEGVITDEGVKTQKVKSAVWDELLSRKQLNILFLSPDYLSLVDLFRSAASLRARGENPLRYEMVLWKRLTMPVVIAVMMFLSVPFILSGLGRINVGTRTVAGALTGIGFQMFNQTFARFGFVYALPPVLTALLPVALALTFGLWLLSRAE